MPFFNYTAIKDGRGSVSGRIEASTLKEAREFLRRMNLTPTRLEQQEEVIQEIKALKPIKLRRLSMRQKIDFTNTLYILSKTGISLVESLFFIEMNTHEKNVKNLAMELRRQVLGGTTLSEAIAKYPGIFDHVYSGLIKTGEESGELDITLQRMVKLLEKQDKLASDVKATMMYPCFIIFIACVVTLVMLTFVFPAFKEMYSGMGKQLPLITSVLMDTGVFLRNNWYIIPIILGSIVYGLYFIFTWPVTKRSIDFISLKIPVLRMFVKFASLSNFVAVLKVAFDAGVPIVNSLMLANLTVGNYIMKDAIRIAALRVQQGKSISAALKESQMIPGIIMAMIATGEQAGQLGEMLELATEYIDNQLERIIAALSKIFEPILLVVIGCVVLVLALALYLPLFQSYTNIV